MCHVCVMRLESDFLCGANCFFFPNPSTSGQTGAIWFKRLGWDAGETETDACTLYATRLFVKGVADGQICAILS